jgi:hypothetical protein
MTQETVAYLEKSVGKLLKGWLSLARSLEKSVHGACLRAYFPEVQTCEPTAGSLLNNP